MPSSFREEDFLNFSQSETRIAHCDYVFRPIWMKLGNLIEDLPYMLPVKFALFGQAVSEEKIFRNQLT